MIRRRFYVGVTTAFVVIVFVGFAPTYYLKQWFSAPALSLLVHAHGLVMTLWMALLVAQVALVETRRVGWHRRVGRVGGFLGAAVVLLGSALALTMAKRVQTPERQALLCLQLVNFTVFAVLLALGMRFRKTDVESHRRFMLLASVSILTAPFSRFPLPVALDGPLSTIVLVDACVVVCVVGDFLVSRRIHRVSKQGAALVVLSHPLSIAISATNTWLHIAHTLEGLF